MITAMQLQLNTICNYTRLSAPTVLYHRTYGREFNEDMHYTLNLNIHKWVDLHL